MNFIKDSIEEIRKVTWPTRNQAITLSIIVTIFTIVSTGILIVSDKSFRAGYEALLKSSSKVQNQEAVAPVTTQGGVTATDSEGNPIEINLDEDFSPEEPLN